MAASSAALFAQAEIGAEAPRFPTAELIESGKDATVTDSGVTARIFQERRAAIDPDDDVPVLQVTVGGKMVLEYVGTASGLPQPSLVASIAEIDRANQAREVYFSSYSGGAHCCSEVVVATETAEGWVAVPVGAFDGDGEYLQDLNDDGQAEIVTVDNDFLYAFDCYACSAAPLVIKTVRDGKLVDITTEPRFAQAHRNWLRQLEADSDPVERWKSPGFLAGWVAASIRAGSGEEAFKQLRKHWDLASDSGEEACLNGADVDSCAPADRKNLKFPDRLKLFLDRHGYAN